MSPSAPRSSHTPSSSLLCATNSSLEGMSTPYTLGCFTGGAAEARYTLVAPAARHICTICDIVVPRTMESSTRRTFLPLNTLRMALSLRLTESSRVRWSGMMNVRPT